MRTGRLFRAYPHPKSNNKTHNRDGNSWKANQDFAGDFRQK